MSLPAASDKPAYTIITGMPKQERRKQPLCDCVRTSLALYFNDLDGHAPQKLHHMVMSQVERPLIEMVMKFSDGNQTKAAEILGINRSTLRKKLIQYGLE